MKKLLLTIGLVAIGASAFAQGNVIFGSGLSYVWNTNSVRPTAGSVDTAFLFSTVNVAPTVAGVLTSTPTNSINAGLSSAQNTTAWSDILTDPNFHLATNNTGSAEVVGSTTGVGGITYNGGSAFQLANTSASGGTIYVYAIAWNSAYATAQAAAAAGSDVGWSSTFAYAYVAGPVPGPAGTATSFSSQQSGWQFGVLGTVVATPEPSTLALAALGGASLLLFRRRSSK